MRNSFCKCQRSPSLSSSGLIVLKEAEAEKTPRQKALSVTSLLAPVPSAKRQQNKFRDEHSLAEFEKYWTTYHQHPAEQGQAGAFPRIRSLAIGSQSPAQFYENGFTKLLCSQESWDLSPQVTLSVPQWSRSYSLLWPGDNLCPSLCSGHLLERDPKWDRLCTPLEFVPPPPKTAGDQVSKQMSLQGRFYTQTRNAMTLSSAEPQGDRRYFCP